MKTVRYHPRAELALLKYRAHAKRIVAKMAEYAANPMAHKNNIKRLKGRERAFRLRVGDYRIIFAEDEKLILVTDIGPRGSVYD